VWGDVEVVKSILFRMDLVPQTGLYARKGGKDVFEIEDRGLEQGGKQVTHLPSDKSQAYKLQTNRPASQELDSVWYYEICLAGDTKISKPRMAIGFALTPIMHFRGQVGWMDGTVGYHGDDGKLYFEKLRGGEDIGPAWLCGDVVGCGWDTVSQEVFFTHNGNLLERRVSVASWSGCDMYPTISSKTPGLVFQVRMSEEEWLYRP